MRYYIRVHSRIVVTLIAFIIGATQLLQAQPSAAEGKTLFNQCLACHQINAVGVGPALLGVTRKYEREWLYQWIKNPIAFAQENELAAQASQLMPSAMTPFPNLSQDQIESILLYIEEETERIENPPPPPPGDPTSVAGDPFANPTIYYGLLTLVGALVIVALLLVVIAAILVTAIRAKEQKEPIEFGNIVAQTKALLTNKFVITAITTFVLVGGLAKFIMEARTVGLHQGYMPKQPIAFSHKLHAGEYQIDCKYCHSGTTKSKSAWIPSANVCMNCHTQIRNRHEPAKRHPDAKEDGSVSPEIAKIYAAVGWDPATFSFTGEEKPIEWIRIHNVPDHAYFNHAQHVVVGNLECQTCHGPVENMEVVYQYSDLGMGWCVNCHRNEKVKVLGEPTEHTVEDMGGLDCARCHY